MLGSISNGLGVANLAEDICRSQMAEQVVGSDKAFRMAVEEMLGRALKKGELEDMMQKRMLDPEKLFPLVGKYFHKLATEGGALEKKLKQLQAVESRMKESWIQFVNELYNKGVEAALIKLYKGIDRVANSVKQLAGNAIGKFLKGALDAISFVALNLLDVFQIVIYLIDQAFGKSSDIKSTTAEILGWVVGFAAMAKIASGILGTMKTIAGISAKLGLGGSGGAAKVGMVGKMLIIGAEAAFFFGITNAIIDALGLRDSLKKAGGNLYSNTHNTNPLSPDFGKFNVDKMLSSFGVQNMISPALMLNGIKNLMTEQKPQQVDVNITMSQNAKDFVDAQIQDNNQRQYNMLKPPAPKYSYITTP